MKDRKNAVIWEWVQKNVLVSTHWWFKEVQLRIFIFFCKQPKQENTELTRLKNFKKKKNTVKMATQKDFKTENALFKSEGYFVVLI